MSALLRNVDTEIAKRERERADLRQKAEGYIKRIQLLEAELRELNSFKEGWEQINRPALPAPKPSDTRGRGTDAPTDQTAEHRPAPILDRAKEQIIAVLQGHDSMSPGQARHLTGLGEDPFRRAFRELLDTSVVWAEGKTAGRRIGLVATRDAQEAGDRGRTGQALGHDRAKLRPRLIAAIDSDPGTHTEGALATLLDADREDVAHVCGALLEENIAVRLFDGTYQIIVDVEAEAA